MKEKLAERMHDSKGTKILGCLLGGAIYSFGVNTFIVPLGLYSGGFVGVSQIIRTLLMDGLQTDFGGRDVAGILYFLINIPVLIMAYRCLGKKFFAKTITCVVANSFFMSVIPIPATPILEDTLTGCLIGGIVCGLGGGLIFKNGGSGGGTDVLGVYFTQKYRSASVGRISMVLNGIIYSICLLLFKPAVAIYSIIYVTFQSFVVDKVYTQVINVQATIMTNSDGEAIRRAILDQFHRGVTLLDGVGGYTGQPRKVMYTVLSKYEAGILTRMIHELDPDAFVVLTEGCSVSGRYLRHLG